jgi:hypothetical protein
MRRFRITVARAIRLLRRDMRYWIDDRALVSSFEERPMITRLSTKVYGLCAGAASIMLIAAPGTPALADQCKPLLQMASDTKATSAAAAAQATARWRQRVAVNFGSQFSDWATARGKSVTCTGWAVTGFKCQARGRPCWIQ